MAMIGKAGFKCNLRQREIGTHEQFLSPFDASLKEIAVRRDPSRLLESSSKMVDGKLSVAGQRFEINIPVHVRVDVFAYPP